MSEPVDAEPGRAVTERQGRVLLIRMNRPSRRNAIDAAMTAALDAALNEQRRPGLEPHSGSRGEGSFLRAHSTTPRPG
ncbi:hypothetical protein ACFYVR_16815 [Rhodococcus sp. NPDC003318]|uniref:hypothetical protein n=1 Tax=Rhodococcus sp. NPDC003318 TaxID=3364503 RepID=UPI0036AC75BB